MGDDCQDLKPTRSVNEHKVMEVCQAGIGVEIREELRNFSQENSNISSSPNSTTSLSTNFSNLGKTNRNIELSPDDNRRIGTRYVLGGLVQIRRRNECLKVFGCLSTDEIDLNYTQ